MKIVRYLYKGLFAILDLRRRMDFAYVQLSVVNPKFFFNTQHTDRGTPNGGAPAGGVEKCVAYLCVHVRTQIISWIQA